MNMITIERIILLYLIIVNAAAFLLMLADKQKAKQGAWRIPEKTLIGAAAIGGSIGALCGMYLFRHKTKHLVFQISAPVGAVLSAAALLLLMARLLNLI